MNTRNTSLAVAALIVAATAWAIGATGARAADEKAAPAANAKVADFLFVQNASAMSYADGRLTLKGISPATVLFTDRPQRIAGHMDTTAFVPFWNEGIDSFQSDPPNANLSILGEKEVIDAVVVLSNPKLEGNDLSYDVKILQGEVPASGGTASLFIDIIGMPLTPISYAGAARRAYRHGYYHPVPYHHVVIVR